MADVQDYFDWFHSTIKLGRSEHAQTLREKRDIVREKLNRRLPAVFAAARAVCPRFEFRDQGSYSMDTGVVPVNGDFDIDQALYFYVDPEEYPNPVLLKRRVRDALAGHTPGDGTRDGVTVRRPCVTVQYHRAGEPVYHVDIAIYSHGSCSSDGVTRLAMGKEQSGPEHRYWQASDPRGLSGLVSARFRGADLQQFKRVVRYLKRWKDENFKSKGHAAPPGIALTVAAYDHLQPSYRAGRPDDLSALGELTDALTRRFETRHNWFFGTRSAAIRIELPVEPRSNLCERMTGGQMERFLTKLECLKHATDAARRTRSEQKACVQLRAVLGDDFPSPDER